MDGNGMVDILGSYGMESKLLRVFLNEHRMQNAESIYNTE